MKQFFNCRAASFRALRRFKQDASGATAIEYALIAGLLSVSIVGALLLFGGNVEGLWNFTRDEVIAGLAGD